MLTMLPCRMQHASANQPNGSGQPASHPAAAPSVVIGTAIGYGEAQLSPFVSSLRRSGYHGEIILIVDQGAVSTLRESGSLQTVSWYPVRPLRVNLRHRRARYRDKVWLPLQTLEWLPVRMTGRLPLSRRHRRELQCALAARLFHPELSRFVYYERLLASRRSVSRVLLTDVRDVLFQTNPFEVLGDQALAFGMESCDYTNDTEYWNRRWIRASYGDRMLERLTGCQVACAGVVYGSRDRVLEYLGLMVDEILTFTLAGFAQMADQAAHNALLWTGRLGSPVLHQTLASPIATLNRYAHDQVRLDDHGRLLNDDGSIVSVVHQYDRVAGLAEALTVCESTNAQDLDAQPVSVGRQ